MRNKLIILSLLILTVLPGCSTAFGSDQKDLYIFLIDKSASTTELAYRNQKTFIEQKISDLPAGVTAVAIPITANPLSGDRDDSVKIELPGTHLYKFHEDTKVNAAKQQFIGDVEQMLDHTPVAQGTAIMDSLRLAEDAIPENEETKVRIILVSDMMEASARLNLYEACPALTPQKIDEIITAESDAGRLPEKLKGAEINVIGAGVGNQTMDVACRDDVETFWRSYFSAVGSNVTEYDPVPMR